jgi:hypothetical protein
MMMEATKENHSHSHWIAYYESTFQIHDLVESQTPFFGTKWWERITDLEKKKLELGFRQINAEVIIHLEQGLLVAARKLSDKKADLELQYFVKDELTHIAAFRDFLDHEFQGKWHENSLLLFHRDRYRKLAFWLFNWEPLSVFLPGAKSEIYAIQYYQSLRPHKSVLNPKWFKLIELHAQDEIDHIQTDLATLNIHLAQMPISRKIKLYIATLLSIGLTQWSLALTAYRLIDRVFFYKNIFQRLRLTMAFVGWVLWQHNAFPNTRKIFSRLIAREKERYFKHFSFLGW